MESQTSNEEEGGTSSKPASSKPASPKPASNKRATSDVALLPALLIAIPLYGISVTGAKELPRHARDVLLERGYVTQVILMLTCLAVAILGLKIVGLVRQKRAFRIDLVPGTVERITPDNVASILEHLEAKKATHGFAGRTRSFLLERVSRVLQHFAARGDASETAAAQTTESDADASAVATSFSIVRVLVWAMPILGFIGTVIGISESMGGFSRSLDGAAEFDSIKGSLGEVTTGLALAFDTTLVALVASVFLMLPMSWISKAEEQLISDVDDRCMTNLLRLLANRDKAEVTKEEPVSASALGLGAEGLGEMLAANAKLMNRLAEDREAVEVAQTVLANHLSAFAAASHMLGPAVERAAAQLERATTQLEQMTATADRSTAATERTQEQLARELGASRQLLSLLAAGLTSAQAPVSAPATKYNGHAGGAREGVAANGQATLDAE